MKRRSEAMKPSFQASFRSRCAHKIGAQVIWCSPAVTCIDTILTIEIKLCVTIYLFKNGDLLQLCLSHQASLHNVLVCGESFCSGSAGEKIP